MINIKLVDINKYIKKLVPATFTLLLVCYMQPSYTDNDKSLHEFVSDSEIENIKKDNYKPSMEDVFTMFPLKTGTLTFLDEEFDNTGVIDNYFIPIKCPQQFLYPWVEIHPIETKVALNQQSPVNGIGTFTFSNPIAKSLFKIKSCSNDTPSGCNIKVIFQYHNRLPYASGEEKDIDYNIYSPASRSVSSEYKDNTGYLKLSYTTYCSKTPITIEEPDKKLIEKWKKKISNGSRSSRKDKSLLLKYNDIGDEEAQAIAAVLAEDRTITSVDLSRNNIGNDGIQALATALEKNTILKELNLSHNRISNEGAQHLAKALEINTSLVEIDLYYNNIGDQGAQLLIDTLEKNVVFRKIHLYKNHISDNLLIAQKKIMVRKEKIKEMERQERERIKQEKEDKKRKAEDEKQKDMERQEKERFRIEMEKIRERIRRENPLT